MPPAADDHLSPLSIILLIIPQLHNTNYTTSKSTIILLIRQGLIAQFCPVTVTKIWTQYIRIAGHLFTELGEEIFCWANTSLQYFVNQKH